MEKPGYKSTEFWLSLVATIVGAVIASGSITNDTALQILGVVASIFTTLGYQVNRTWAKNKALQESAKVEVARSQPPKT